ncbi:MAG: hypothetical protein C4321_07215, partial [Chloroflexota bacterium]
GELPPDQLREVRDFVLWNLQSQQGPLDEVLDHLMSAFEYGYSLTAIRWGSHPAWRRRWVIERLTPLPPSLFRPRVETDGSVSGVVGPDGFLLEDPHSYIYVRWNPKFGSPYGRSQLLAAYEAWWNKTTLRRMRNLTLDRFGAPFITVRVAPTTEPQKREALAEQIRDFHSHGGAVLDDTDRIELITAPGTGSADYQHALEYENLEILAAICGATLNASQSATGSYAQARVHQEMFLYQVQRLADTLEA